jgi:hypothetical protein
MKWVTREDAKVDRIACPWLIRRFVDKDAEFLYVPADQVMSVARREGAIPYDVPSVELGHVDGRCSFGSILHRKIEMETPMYDALYAWCRERKRMGGVRTDRKPRANNGHFRGER